MSQDYSRQGFKAVAWLIVVLLGVSFIPPQTVGNVTLRRANILSDIVTFDDPEKEVMEILDERDYEIDLAQVALRVAEAKAVNTLPDSVPTTIEWNLMPLPDSIPTTEMELTPPTRMIPIATPIEDFDETGYSRVEAFYRKLQTNGLTTRIAVLGDSFIEGDIMTAELREQLQQRYGGQGAGFAPMDYPLSGFRQTIRATSNGWTTYNILQNKTPAWLKEDYFISGWMSIPSTGASTRWEAPLRTGLLSTPGATGDFCERVRILFISRSNSRVEVTVNDATKRTFEIQGSDEVRQIVVRAPIRSLTFRVAGGANGFIGYGAIFEGETGVVVDNYAVRSDNGRALLRTNPSIDAQIDALIGGYDLIVLQYGLNILQADLYSYTRYGSQLEKMIAYARQCFPRAGIVVMGVSDRSVKSSNGQFEPMRSATALLKAQRGAAERMGAAFWSTFDAIRSQGGISQFVRNGWAGKDYTHVNFAGGRRVAWSLFDAVNDAAEQHKPIIWIRHDPVITPETEQEFKWK